MQSSIPTGLLITAFLADTFALLAAPDMSTLKTSNYFSQFNFAVITGLKQRFCVIYCLKNCNLLQLHSFIIYLQSSADARCRIADTNQRKLLIICLYVTHNIHILLCILISEFCFYQSQAEKDNNPVCLPFVSAYEVISSISLYQRLKKFALFDISRKHFNSKRNLEIHF